MTYEYYVYNNIQLNVRKPSIISNIENSRMININCLQSERMMNINSVGRERRSV